MGQLFNQLAFMRDLNLLIYHLDDGIAGQADNGITSPFFTAMN